MVSAMSPLPLALLSIWDEAPEATPEQLGASLRGRLLPLLDALEQSGSLRLSLQLGGSALGHLLEHAPAVVRRLTARVEEGRLELLLGGFSAFDPTAGSAASAALQLDGALAALAPFGIAPRAAWMHGGAFDPRLVPLLVARGIETLAVDARVLPPRSAPRWVGRPGEALRLVPVAMQLSSELARVGDVPAWRARLDAVEAGAEGLPQLALLDDGITSALAVAPLLPLLQGWEQGRLITLSEGAVAEGGWWEPGSFGPHGRLPAAERRATEPEEAALHARIARAALRARRVEGSAASGWLLAAASERSAGLLARWRSALFAEETAAAAEEEPSSLSFEEQVHGPTSAEGVLLESALLRVHVDPTGGSALAGLELRAPPQLLGGGPLGPLWSDAIGLAGGALAALPGPFSLESAGLHEGEEEAPARAEVTLSIEVGSGGLRLEKTVSLAEEGGGIEVVDVLERAESPGEGEPLHGLHASCLSWPLGEAGWVESLEGEPLEAETASHAPVPGLRLVSPEQGVVVTLTCEPAAGFRWSRVGPRLDLAAHRAFTLAPGASSGARWRLEVEAVQFEEEET